MKSFILILIFLSNNCLAQLKKLDFGNVRGENFTSCKYLRDGKICQSKNQFEVLFTNTALLAGTYVTFNLSYDGEKWSAIKYEGNWINNTVDTFKLIPLVGFDSVFTALKENKLFILPDQNKLNAKGEVMDGNEYRLIFKAGNKFRTYEFSNPADYIKQNKDIPEFVNYANIVDVFYKLLIKE